MTEPTYRLPIAGMTCEHCEVAVARALSQAGATNVTASFRRNEARFTLPPTVSAGALTQAVSAAGYQPGTVVPLHATASVRAARESETKPKPNRFDLAVIGSGGAAMAAAIAAQEAGARVVMLERGTLGGTCVNIGCVPSKTLLRAGELYHQAGHHPFRGIETSAGQVDLAGLVGQKDELVSQLRHDKYEELIADYGWDLVRGEARFADGERLAVNGRTIAADRFIVATGADPAVPGIPGLAESGYLTSTTALALTQVPKRLVVIGAGYIALELGQLFAHLGSQVTLTQRSPRLLKSYDPKIAEVMHQVLTEAGIEIVTGARFERVTSSHGHKQVHVVVDGAARVIEGDAVLVATGRQPNTAALHLEAAGVQLGSRGEVLIDDWGRTTNPAIFAAGDVTLGPQFVYVAAYEGSLAARNALGHTEQRLDLRAVPGITFTTPAIATVGLTEAQAREAGYTVKTSVLPASAVPRALVNHDTRGVFKLVADAATDRILGAHVVAEHAGEVIYAGVLAVKFNLTVSDLTETLAPYLTMAEGLKLAAQTFGRDVRKLSCCAA